MAADGTQSGDPGLPRLGRYEARLLVWTLQEAGGKEGVPVPTADFGLRQNIPGPGLTAVTDSLEERGWVRVHELRSSGPVISLRGDGCARAQDLSAESRDPVARQRHAEDGLVAWAYENRGTPGLRLRDFFVSKHIFLYDAALTENEVTVAAAYLHQEGLHTLVDDPRGSLDAVVTLTSSGTACAAAGDGVEEYLARRRDWDMSVQDFAELITQQGRRLGLSEADLTALLQDTARLRQEEPGPAESSRLRQFGESINSRLRGAPGVAGREVLIEAVKEALRMFV